MGDFVSALLGVVSGILVGVTLTIQASQWLDDARIERGHFEHRGSIYLVTPAKAVAR